MFMWELEKEIVRFYFKKWYSIIEIYLLCHVPGLLKSIWNVSNFYSLSITSSSEFGIKFKISRLIKLF